MSSESKETYNTKIPKRALELAFCFPLISTLVSEILKSRAQGMISRVPFEELISNQDLILDIGSGSGHIAQAIKQKYGPTVIKLDLDDLRALDTKDRNYVLASATNLPFKEERMDCVLLWDIVHHNLNHARILEEALQVLKPGGLLVLVEDTIPESSKFRKKLSRFLTSQMDDLLNLQPPGVNPHNYHPIEEWQDLFSNLGLEIIQTDTSYWGFVDFTPWGGRIGDSETKKQSILRPFESTTILARKPPTKVAPAG